MDKNTLLLSLYQGRRIDHPAFEKHFYANGANNIKEFIHEGLGEFDFVEYQVFVDVAEDRVTSVSVFKTDESDCGHGRPSGVLREPTSTQWKRIYEVLDECFPDHSGDEVAQVIDTALSLKCSFGGYSIKKVLKSEVEFTTPVGAPVKLTKKRIAQAVAFSHKDIAIIRTPEAAKEFAACFGKAPFEPLFAILSTIDPATYENYDSLNTQYRFKDLLEAIKNGDYDRVTEYPDVLNGARPALYEIGNAVANSGNTAIGEWFFEHVPAGNCNLNGMLYTAIKQGKREITDAILSKQLYDPNESITSWRYPMEAALDHKECVLPLLQHGFVLRSDQYIESLSLDLVKQLLEYRVALGSATLNRIMQEQRYDILQIVENDPDKYCSGIALIDAYIEAKDYDRFCRGVQLGWAANATKTTDSVIEKAFYVSESWATQIIESGYDVNHDSGHLLHEACRADIKADFAIFLMEHGADPHLRSQYESTVFEYAAGFHGHLDNEELARQEKLCRYLLDKGVDPIMESRRTPSIFAYLMNLSTEFKLYLVDWIADRGELNYYECQNDKSISEHGLLECVISSTYHYDSLVFRRMIERGVHVNASGQSDAKLFLEACAYCTVDDLMLFVKAGGNTEELDNRYKTNGLYTAVMHKQSKEVVEYLVSIGLDVNSKKPGVSWQNIPPKSVLDIAEINGDQAIIDLLRSNGAKHAYEL